MKYKTVSFHAIIPIFLLQCLLLHGLASASKNNKNASPLEFFKQFQGSQKGDKVKGIHALKKYLRTLGYLDYDDKNNPSITPYNSHNQFHVQDDYFDENLESAIKTYQINFNLNPTGTLDLKTVSLMGQPRCGVPDIVNGTTRMSSSRDHNINIPSTFHSHYKFFYNRWPLDKKTITYALEPGTRPDLRDPVHQAFLSWSAVTPFSYVVVDDYNTADIKISYQNGDHGDGYPFDGPGPMLGHAFAPTDGRVHLDEGNNWTVGAIPGGNDMQTVVLHELGHALGLGHSSIEAAVMWPYAPYGGAKRILHDDDIEGIQALYNI